MTVSWELQTIDRQQVNSFQARKCRVVGVVPIHPIVAYRELGLEGEVVHGDQVEAQQHIFRAAEREVI